MKKYQSNDVSLPKWLSASYQKQGETAYTLEQVGTSIELNLQLNGSAESLRKCIGSMVKKVQLQHRPMLEAFIAGSDEHLFACTKAYLEVIQQNMAELPKEKSDGTVQHEETRSSRGEDAGDEWGIYDGRVQGKQRSRGNRAVRSAKRQQGEFGS